MPVPPLPPPHTHKGKNWDLFKALLYAPELPLLLWTSSLERPPTISILSPLKNETFTSALLSKGAKKLYVLIKLR